MQEIRTTVALGQSFFADPSLLGSDKDVLHAAVQQAGFSNINIQ